MFKRHCLIVFAVAVLGLGMGPTRAAKAAFYRFTGTVTSVDDPFGAFSSLAALGAPVSGTFGYSESATYTDSAPFNSSVTGYFNERADRPQDTDLELVINGAAQRASPYSLTNLDVGDDTPIGTPFFPAGDFFRYFDAIDSPSFGQDALVDYDRFPTDSYAVPFGSISLDDPTGAAFSSQSLPRGPLALSSFTDRFGEFSFYDGNGEDIYYGSIGFRIDGIEAVPEPSSLVLLAVAALAGAAVGPWRRSRRSPSAGLVQRW